MLRQHARARAEASDLNGIAAAADPNLLLSTILQSSVAMVAALAGLWIWRAQERSRATERWRRAREELAAAEQAFGQVNEAIERQAVRAWLLRAMDQLVRTPDASVEFLLSRCGPPDRDTSSLPAAIAEVATYVRQAQVEIVDVSGNQLSTADWEEFRNTHGIPVTSPLQQIVYERVYLKLWMEQRAAAVLPFSPSPDTHPEPSSQTTRDDEEIDRPLPGRNLVVTSAEGQRLEAELAEAVRRMLQAAAMEESARTHLSWATKGWSAKWYLVVTGYATLIGIVTPGIVLTVGPTALDAAFRWLLFGSFCTVVLAILATFASTIGVRGKAILARRRG